MSVKRHLHRYRRRTTITLKGKEWVRWFCILPNCNHWVQSKEDLLGKEALCFYCSEKFVITDRCLEKAKISCGECRGFIGQIGESGAKIVNIPKGEVGRVAESVQDANSNPGSDDDDTSGLTIGGLSLEEILEGRTK